MTTSTANYRIWVISEGNPGHYNQSAALAEALALRHNGVVEWIEARLAVRGFLRPLVAWLLNFYRGALPDRFFRLFYRLNESLPAGSPDLIVSSGGKSAFLNVLLARMTGAKNLFIGQPPRLRCDNFTAVLVLEGGMQCRNCLLIDALPTRVTPEMAAQQGRHFIEEHHLAGVRLWCMLIGGSSRSHRYSAEDWRELAQGMNALAESNGIKWLVTTSRRTGAECEAILGATLRADSLADAAYWGEEPRKVVMSYLGAAEVAFCTQDSLTMITEAIATWKPVYAIYPRAVSLSHDSARFYKSYLERNVVLGRLRTAAISVLGSIDVQHDRSRYFVPIKESLMDKTVSELESFLQEWIE